MPNSTPDSIEGASGSSTLHEIQIDEDIGVDGLPSDLDADVEKRVQVSEEQSELGPKIVDWDGPDDPENGINWPIKKKWRIVLLISVFTFISPLASSMFAPGVPELLADFHQPENLLASFVVSVYLLGFAFGPLVIGPLSEMYGRAIIYQVTLVMFIVFTIACAVSSNMSMLIGFRLLAGLAGSAPVTMGGGTCADLFVQEERGKAMSIWAMGPLVGPVVGPIAGGFLADAIGWRWVFWIIAIASGIVAVLYMIFLPETYGPILLERKVKTLRKETGNKHLRSKMDPGLEPLDLFKHTITRPFKMLLFSPIVAILSLMMAITYGYLYLVFTTITEVFVNNYGFGHGVVGLVYIGIGAGMMLGLFAFGSLSDALLKKLKASGMEMRPEDRLPLLLPGYIAMPIGLLIYGWTAQYKVFWFVPIFGTTFIGLALIGTFMPITAYIVDAYPTHASSAIAATSILRASMGALLPLAGPKMYATLGLGWGNSLLAFIAVALLPAPILLKKYGEILRKNPRFQVNL